MRSLVVPAMLAACILGSGCVTDGGGSVSFYVTAAPVAEWQEIHLVFGEVVLLQTSDSPTETPTGSYAEAAAARHVVLDLAGADIDAQRAGRGSALFVGEMPAPVGTYASMELGLTAYGVDSSGQRYEARVPSLGAHTTVPVLRDQESRIQLRLDVSDWDFKPSRDGWMLRAKLLDLRVTHVADGASGSDVHQLGQRVSLT